MSVLTEIVHLQGVGQFCLGLTKLSTDIFFLAGVNSLSQSLSANSLIANTLVYLDLSGNALRGDDLSVSTFFSFGS